MQIYRNDGLDNDPVLAVPDPIVVPQRQFIKTKMAEILTRHSDKHYRAVYNKGRILPDLNVAPYGWRY